MPTSTKTSYEILKVLKSSRKDTVIDLGSGFGSLSIFLAYNLPEKKIIAYELSFFPWIVSLILKRLLRVENLTIYKKDFLKVDLKGATLVCYLFPEGMKKLEDKLFDDAINTEIISNTFAFRNIKARRVINTSNIYKTPIYYYDV